MKYAICLIIIISFSLVTCTFTPSNDSISYCEFLVECEMISQLQEKLCLGNSILTPYWLPSHDPTDQRCHLLLGSRYRKLDRLVHESNSLLQLCMIEHSLPLNEHQKQRCDQSLFEKVSELNENDDGLALDRCFQGSKRFERQCGPLRQCCNAYDGCKELVKRSFITKQKETLLREIRDVAKKCEEGIYQENNVTTSANKTIGSEVSPTLIIFTNQTDNDDVMKNFLHNSPQQWYMALKAKLMKETQNLMFQKGTTVSYDDFTTNKNDSSNHTLQNIIIYKTEESKDEENTLPDEIEKWDNETYRKDIEEYQAWKAQPNLKHSKEIFNESFCDSYIRCRRQVEKSMDRCQMLWNNVDQLPLLSTVTLLRTGDRCIDRDNKSFTELYEIVIKRNDELHGCLDKYHNQTDESMECSITPTNHTQWHWMLVESEDLQNTKNLTNCLAQVNVVQFKCAQLSKCCPHFDRCRNETFDTKAELRIALLTAQLITQNYDCLRHKLMTATRLR
ncbi:putative ABC transporter ATP-binding protein [Dirofilaria immitis]